MNDFDFLAHLRTLDIQVIPENGKLRINAPPGAVTPALKDELTTRKAEILAILSAMEPIQTAPQGGPLPLSLGQEHLWQLHRLTPDTAAYNMYAVFHLHGQLDIPALEIAICRVVERHESLRTAFPKSIDGLPEQRTIPATSIPLHTITLPVSGNARDDLESIINTEIRSPFDLFSGPLFRPTLVHLNSTEYVLIFVMHHMISDGHSFGVFYEDLELAYRASCEGVDVGWQPLPVQYSDYAVWHRKWLTSDASDSDRKYWQMLLNGNVPALEIPFDHPHPLHPVADGDYVPLDIGGRRSTSLQEFCRREGITLFTAVLAAFTVLLHRHSGQRDLVIGTPVAARDRMELTRLIGYFNNTLLLRIDLSKADTLRDLLQQTHTMVMNSLGHQMFPFKEVAEFPNLTRTPLSRAMVAVLDSSDKTLSLPALETVKMPIFGHTVQYDLSLEVVAHPRGLDGRLMYRKALFERDTVKELAEEFLVILDEILLKTDSLVRPNDLILQTERSDFPASRPPYIGPANDLQCLLAQIWQEVLQVEKVGIHDEFFELGGHSLLALRLFTRIEQETGTRLPLSALFQTTTIAHLALLIENENRGHSWECLVPIQLQGEKPPFFLVHGIGGGVLGYRDLVNELGTDQPVLGLQAAGQDGRETYDLTIKEMASRYIGVMRAFQPQGPYRIGGYCFGGVVAYEMACQLSGLGEKVSLLALFESSLVDTVDTRASLPRRAGAIWKSIPAWLQDYARMDSRQLLNRLRFTVTKIWSKLQRNSDFERRVRVEETLDFDIRNLPSRNLELTTVHMQAALQYESEKYNGLVTLFRARNRSINEVVFGSLDPEMGWGHLAQGGVNVHLVDGYHRNMHLSPYAKSLAGELKKCLDGDV